MSVDRIVGVPRHSADPVRLELSRLSATRYALSTHPEKRNGPVAP